MTTIHHMSASIEGLLKLSDKQLEKLTGLVGKQARRELKERKQRGEKVIQCSNDCVGFSPLTGCPGHKE